MTRADNQSIFVDFSERESIHALASRIPFPGPAAAHQGAGAAERPQFRVTCVTDGTCFRVHCERKGESGIDLRFSSDGTNTKVSVRAEQARHGGPGLRLYCDSA